MRMKKEFVIGLMGNGRCPFGISCRYTVQR
jgi:hypothetical protein